MLSDIQKALFEINYLGCHILKEDKFKPFEISLNDRLKQFFPNPEMIRKIAVKDIIDIISKSLVQGIGSSQPVVLLSGGIDSTLIAAILKEKNIDYTCYSYVLDSNDPTLERIKYVEKKLGIKSKIIFYEKEAVSRIWTNYFDFYDSPSMDYATLVMGDFLNKMKFLEGNKDLVLLDGIGADDLFGCGGLTQKNLIRAYVLRALSGTFLKYYKYNNRKLNIYTSPVIKDTSAITLYQNYIFSRILNNSCKAFASVYINDILFKTSNKITDFYSRHTLMNLFYDGRRVAYKNYGLKELNYKIHYPFFDEEVIAYALSLKNNLKVKPHIKEPLKLVLLNMGFEEKFVYSKKLGFIFDLFDVLSFDYILDNMSILEENLVLAKDSSDFLVSEFSSRNKAIDHYLYGLAMSQKFVKERF